MSWYMGDVTGERDEGNSNRRDVEFFHDKIHMRLTQFL